MKHSGGVRRLHANQALTIFMFTPVKFTLYDQVIVLHFNCVWFGLQRAKARTRVNQIVGCNDCVLKKNCKLVYFDWTVDIWKNLFKLAKALTIINCLRNPHPRTIKHIHIYSNIWENSFRYFSAAYLITRHKNVIVASLNSICILSMPFRNTALLLYNKS